MNLIIIAAISLFLSVQSLASTVRIQSSGFVTSVPSIFTSVEVGDVWSADLYYRDFSNDLTPGSPDALFGVDLVEGSFILNGQSLATRRDFGTDVQAREGLGIDQLLLIHGVDEFFTFEGQQCCSYIFRIDTGVVPSPFASLPFNASIEDVVSLFRFETPNESILQIRAPGTGQTIEGSITSFSATIVPIPATAWLFGSALLGLLGLRNT